MHHTLPPLIVTSMNRDLHKQYAHRFFDTFDRRYDLIVYHEDASDSAGDPPDYIPEWAGHCHTPTTQPEAYRWIEAHKNDTITSYKHHATRFAHKVFAIWHAVMTYTGWGALYSGVIWMDADIVFKQMPSPQELTEWCRRDKEHIALYDRPEHPETGFIWFDNHHKCINEYNSTYYNVGTHFVGILREYYLEDKIYQLKEQHDAFVMGHILRTMFPTRYRSLSTTDKAPGRHPQAISESAKWWDHCKGPRKKTGRSQENTQ